MTWTAETAVPVLEAFEGLTPSAPGPDGSLGFSGDADRFRGAMYDADTYVLVFTLWLIALWIRAVWYRPSKDDGAEALLVVIDMVPSCLSTFLRAYQCSQRRRARQSVSTLLAG